TTLAERAFLAYFDEGESAPIGGFAEVDGDNILFHGMVISRDGTRVIEHIEKDSDPVKAANKTAELLIDQGAYDIIRGARRMNSLNNQNVLVTRAKEQATVFADKIHQFGGNAWIADVTRITCTSKGMENIQLYSYEWVFFTSANGVHCFFNNMKTSATLKNIHIAVVGEKTNQALMQYGRTADFIPSTYNARTMANEFLKRCTVTGRMLLVRGSKARPELVDAFSNANKVFDLLEVYKTEKN